MGGHSDDNPPVGGHPNLIPALAAFGDLASRLQQREDLNRVVAGWTEQHSSEAAMHLLQAEGVTAAKLNNGDDLLHEPQLNDRQYLQWLERDYVGLQPNASAPFRTEAAPIPIESPAPTLGQHNRFVLEDILQLSDPEIAELAELGIIGTRPRLPASSRLGRHIQQLGKARRLMRPDDQLLQHPVTPSLAQGTSHLCVANGLNVQGMGVIYFAKRMLFISRRRPTVIDTMTEGFVAVTDAFHIPVKLRLHGDGNLAGIAPALPLNMNFLGMPRAGNKIDM